MRANPHCLPIYPPKHNENPKNTRSITMVNRLVAADAWTPLPIDSPDVTAIQLQGDYGTFEGREWAEFLFS